MCKSFRSDVVVFLVNKAVHKKVWAFVREQSMVAWFLKATSTWLACFMLVHANWGSEYKISAWNKKNLIGALGELHYRTTHLRVTARMNRVAQNVPKVKNLQGDLFHWCFLPSWWENCIETCKKLMVRGGTRLRHLKPHLPYGYQGKNATFWWRSFLTPLIAWKAQTNIHKQICISQCPTRDP